MTDQGKPSVCPTCGSDDPYAICACDHPWHSSPVPAATTETELLEKAARKVVATFSDENIAAGLAFVMADFGDEAKVSAPQAESAPDAEKWMRQLGFLIGPWNNAVATKYAVISWMNGYAKVYAASETAALRAERDKWRDLEEHEAKFSQALERENASLKRRIDDLEGGNG